MDVVDDNGDRQRLTNLERRVGAIEERIDTGFVQLRDQIGTLRTDVAVGFARLETRQEAEDRARRHDQQQAQGIGSLVSTPQRQAAAILGTLLAAVVAAVLQLLGVEIGAGG